MNPTFLLDFTCNPRYELKLNLWKSKKFCKEKLQARKEKKMAHVKSYETMYIKSLQRILGVHE
jgi:hypothetical protein